MWHQPVDIALLQTVRRQGLVNNPPQRIGRHAKDFVALHLDKGTGTRRIRIAGTLPARYVQ